MPIDPFNMNQDTDSNSTNQNNNTSSNSPELEYLKRMNATLDKLLEAATRMSQQDAKDRFNSREEVRRNSRQSSNTYKNSARRTSRNAWDSFTDAFEDELIKGLLGSDFRDKIKEGLDDFADSLGVSLEDVPDVLGRELSKQALSAVQNSKLGENLTNRFNAWKDKSIKDIQQAYTTGQNNYWKNRAGREEAEARAQAQRAARMKSGTSKDTDDTEDLIKEAKESIKRAASDSLKNTSQQESKSGASDDIKNTLVDSATDAFKDSGAKAAGTAAGSALSGLASAAKTGAKALGPVAAGLIAVELASDAASSILTNTFAPALKNTAEFAKTLGTTFDRANDESERNLRLANERFQKDVEAMITEPFEILKDAAQEVYNAWDQNIRLINGTQGYTKDDLQSLLGSYSERLRSEGLSSVVSSVDITDSLAKVLESGLSGQAAEEFAYQATVLNAAIPSQDFFGYADTYASIAANAIQAGMSQADALQYANSQLQLFASNVLYASRQISGGFTTGLQNAEQLFEQSAQIAQAAGTNNAAQISSVLTTVAGVVGSIAPDLVTSLTDIIYQAATGGNSSNLVALRSLAGINASNTEFLQALAQNPQEVFSDLFNSLGNMQKMSEDNYMEVAEGLSQLFGMSMDTFARIDFNALSDAISESSASSASLQENLKLLASGETTTSAEQQRMQQINEYLIDEGLAYVMDNEVARSIQQHMWDEQLARELMDATYAVELKGDALVFLEGIRHTVDNLMTILNPFKLVGRLVDVVKTADDAKELTADIGALLEAGKVGTGRSIDYYNLTTRNQDLNLTDDIISMFGGTSAYNSVDSFLDSFSGIMDAASLSLGSGVVGAISSPEFWRAFNNTGMSQAIKDTLNTNYQNTPTSVYSWGGSVGKSLSNYLAATSAQSPSYGSTVNNLAQSSSDAVKAATQAKLDQMLDEEYMNKFIENGQTYADWAATAKNFGIADLSKALKDVGYSEESVKARFQSGEANLAAAKQAERYAREELFWDNTEAYLTELNEHALEMIDLQTYANEVLDELYAKHCEFYDAWVDYFVKHTAYSAAYDHTEVSKVQNEEKGKSQDAIYALAEALTKNSVDLLDPTIQTNALLSQILIVVNAIMQQNNETSTGTSLPDTLSALAMGIINK